jgi:hypothetical protein
MTPAGPLTRAVPSVNGELRFAVQNHKHFFNGVVEVMADAGSRRNLTSMKKIELRGYGATIEQGRKRHRPLRRHAPAGCGLNLAGSVCAMRRDKSACAA